jgi:hypothetical protein
VRESLDKSGLVTALGRRLGCLAGGGGVGKGLLGTNLVVEGDSRVDSWAPSTFEGAMVGEGGADVGLNAGDKGDASDAGDAADARDVRDTEDVRGVLGLGDFVCAWEGNGGKGGSVRCCTLGDTSMLRRAATSISVLILTSEFN